MSQSLCAITVFMPETWDNKNGPGYQPGPNPPLALTERQAAMQATRTCSIEGCTRVPKTRGLCGTCHTRLRRRGELELLPARAPTERLAAGLVRASNDCLEWTGCTNDRGYGHIGVAGKTVETHRLAWTLAHGPIPDGLCVLHHCDNPPCCETQPTEGYPDGHLFLGTHADNTADRDAKGRQWNQRKTHCKRGHEFTEANTYIDPKGQRNCRKCRALRRSSRFTILDRTGT